MHFYFEVHIQAPRPGSTRKPHGLRHIPALGHIGSAVVIAATAHRARRLRAWWWHVARRRWGWGSALGGVACRLLRRVEGGVHSGGGGIGNQGHIRAYAVG